MNRFLPRILIGAMCTIWTPGLATAQSPLPERLLTPADFERVGLRGIVRPPADMSDPREGLHFIRASDSSLVLTVAALPGVTTSAELHSTIEAMSPEVNRVNGVGDEAYTGMGGFLLVFRRGATAFALQSGTETDAADKPAVTAAQLAELAKIVATRSSSVATGVTEAQAPKPAARQPGAPPLAVYPGATFDAQTSAALSSSGTDSFFVYVTGDPASKAVAFYQSKTGKQAQKAEEGSFAFFLSGSTSAMPDLTVQANLLGPYQGKTVITIVKHWR